MIELLRRYFGIEPRDDGRKIREKVTGKLLSLDRALEPTLPAFLSLLDVPVENSEWARLDPPQRRRQTLEALKRLLVRESHVQPVLLVVEDLHWIDSETQAWLDLLVESLPTAQMLVVVNYRPEYTHRWGSKTYYQQVRLDALPLTSAQELLEALFGTGPGLELRATLVQLGKGRRALQPMREAEILAERLGDERLRSRVCGILANTLAFLGDVDDAVTFAVRAWTIADAVGDLEAQIQSRMSLQQTHYFRGDYERVVELARENLAALPAERAHESFGQIAPAAIYNRYWLSMSLIPLGRFAEASEHATEALRLAEPMRHAYSIGVLNLAAGALHLWRGDWRGDWRDALVPLDKAISVLRAGSIAILVPRVVASTAWALAQLGERSEALRQLSEARQLLDGLVQRGMVGMYAAPSLAMARACLLLGRLTETRELADLALESSTITADARHLLGDIATHADHFDPVDGGAHYRQALALAEPRGMRPLVAHCHLGLGKLYRRTDKREQAREHLATATTMYREMGMTYWLEKAEAETTDLGR